MLLGIIEFTKFSQSHSYVSPQEQQLWLNVFIQNNEQFFFFLYLKLVANMNQFSKRLRNKQGQTPADIALEQGETDAFKLLQMYRHKDEDHIQLNAAVFPPTFRIHSEPVGKGNSLPERRNTGENFPIENCSINSYFSDTLLKRYLLLFVDLILCSGLLSYFL